MTYTQATSAIGKIQLILFYCGVRTGNFGAGSHIHHLISFFAKQPLIELTLIKTDDKEVDHLQFTNEEGVSVLRIPQPENKLYLTASADLIQKTYARRLMEIMYPFLKDKIAPIVLVNSIDYLNMAMELKENMTCKIVYVHHAWTWKDFNNVPDKLFAEQWSKSGLKNENQALVFTHYQQTIARIATKVVTVTHQAQGFFSEVLGIPSQKIAVIYNGIVTPKPNAIGLTDIRASMGVGQREKIVLFAGRIKAAKGLDYLIEAFKSLVQVIPEVRLVLIGGGDIDTFIPLTAPFWSRVTFTGKLSREEVVKWYQITSIGVLPSLHEQCSFTAIEMRFHKIPLIVSSVDGLDEMFTHKYDSLKLKVQLGETDEKKLDASELANYINLLLRDKELANKIVSNGYFTALRDFTEERMHKKYLELIQKLAFQ